MYRRGQQHSKTQQRIIMQHTSALHAITASRHLKEKQLQRLMVPWAVFLALVRGRDGQEGSFQLYLLALTKCLQDGDMERSKVSQTMQKEGTECDKQGHS